MSKKTERVEIYVSGGGDVVIMEDDLLKEAPILRKRVLCIKVHDVTLEQSNFLKETARFCSPYHSMVVEDKKMTHVMSVSLDGIIRWAREVMCPQVEETAELLNDIFKAICVSQPDLEGYLVSDCVYRNGVCTKTEPCGKSVEILKHLISIVPEAYYRDARNKALLDDIKGEGFTMNTKDGETIN